MRFLPILLFFTYTTLFAGDWPQFLGPSRNGISTETNLSRSWPKEGPPILWSKKVGQGFSGPVLAVGKLFLFHRLDDKEVVECFDATRGTAVWRFDYASNYRDDFGFDEGPRATPTVADGRIYTIGAEEVLHCIDSTTGKKVWAVDCKREFKPEKGFFGYAPSPLVVGSNVIVNVGGENAGVVAFDRQSGRVAWKATSHQASYASPVAATLGGTRHILVFSRSGLLGLHPTTGEVVFEFPWRSPMHASVNAATPLVIDDRIFLTASYDTGAALLRVKLRKPDKIWSSDNALSCHYATPVHAAGFLYGFHGRQEHRPSLRCIELNTGKVCWSEEGFGAGTVTLAGELLLILTERGELLAAPANPEQFKIRNRAQILPFEVRAAPALANGLFFARSKERLVCVDLRPAK